MRLPEGVACHAMSAALSVLLLAGSSPAVLPAAAIAPMTEDQRIVAQAWRLIDRSYVDRSFADQDWFTTRQKAVRKPYDSREAAYDEVRAILATLGDKYTRFLTPAMFDAVYSVATGDVAGIGVELEARAAGPDGRALVALSTVVEGGPAEAAGLQPGDVLEEVDDAGLRGLSPEEAASKVRGAIGSKLRLTVRRDGVDEPLVKLMTRAQVKLAAVTSSLESAAGAKIGYVKVKQFSTATAADVESALASMGGASAYVLDLRGNTGGYFPGGVDVARLFLKRDTPITYVVDKKENVVEYRTYDADGAYSDKPLVLLVDGKTASASEVLTGAMRDNGRAQLVGARTFGKAVIQTVEQLDDNSAVVVTIARYETPVTRANINKRGIEADVVKECPPGKAAVACVPPDLLRRTAP